MSDVCDLIEFRPFRNTDPPALVEIWRAQPPLRANVESITTEIFDKFIFSKPYFDRFGLIVAVENGKPIGFVHAGFGPNETQTDVDHSTGILSQLKILPRNDQEFVAEKLVAHAIEYLIQSGATNCYGGSRFPFAPFYLGLYGGSRIPGVLAGDSLFESSLVAAGFQVTQELLVLSCNLSDFRAPTGRDVITAKRRYMIAPHIDPRARSWWECCSLGMADRDRFNMLDKRTKELAGNVTYWDLIPLANEWGVVARGIYDMRMAAEFQDSHLELFLLGESMRQLKEQGVGLVEAQTHSGNEKALSVFEKLGFEVSDRGTQFAKAIS